MNYAAIIKEIGRGAKGSRHLPSDTAEAVFGDILDGKVPDLELGAMLMSLRIKSESTEELIGFKRAMDMRTETVAVPPGSRCVVLPTYNGARRQPNLMPLVALLLAREGVPVLIQGRHDFETRVSPFQLLEALGIPCTNDPAEAARRLADQHLACIGLDTLLPGLDQLLALRARLGVRGSGHTMAKLLDPCPGHSVRVVAVTHPEYLERMHDFMIASGGRAMLLRGTEGEVYANPRRRPRLECFADGAVSEVLEAEEGGAPPRPEVPDAPAVEENAALIRAMLEGRSTIPGPIREQVACLVRLARG